MKPRLLALLLCAVFALPAPATRAASGEDDQREQRIAAAFLLALGRAPTAGEMTEASAQPPAPLTELLAARRAQLQHDAALKRATILRAAADASGRAPTDEEIAQHLAASPAGIYTELMQHHLQRLATQPAEYEQVVQRAYRFVVGRDAYREEVSYWQQRAPLSYALLVGCVENWARRNQPGLMVTAGNPTVSINSAFLTTVWLSPAIAAEARAAAGLDSATDPVAARAAGHNLVAVGAEELISSGHIYFVAAGAANLPPAPAR